jgi:glycosyltransferase involved in cell wall biosynthesis
MKPRIVFLNNQGLGSTGGGVTILRHLAADLAGDHAVTVVSYDRAASGYDGVRQIALPPVPPPGRLWRLAPLLRARHLARVAPMREIAAADLVVALDCHFASALRRARPRRMIYLSLSCIPRQEWFGGSGGVPGFLQNAWLERSAARRAQIVMASSRIHAAELRRFEWLPGLRPVVMHPVFPGAASAGRNIDPDMPVVLSVGRLEPVKNFAAIIDLADRLRDVRCRFVVLGDGPLLAELRARAVSANLGDRVSFPGGVANIAAELATASLFLHPSRYESFGIGVFEAMLAGVPPIVARGAPLGCRELLQAGVSGCLVDFDSPDEAAGAVRALLVDEARRLAMGEAARRAAEGALALDYAARFRALVADLLADETARTREVPATMKV